MHRPYGQQLVVYNLPVVRSLFGAPQICDAFVAHDGFSSRKASNRESCAALGSVSRWDLLSEGCLSGWVLHVCGVEECADLSSQGDGG